jgi:phosphatidylethanolamine-binding protein (PEBP) family uncharacterized protein
MHVTARSLAFFVLLCTTPAFAQAPAPGPAARPPAMVLAVHGFPDGGQILVRFSQAAPGAAPGGGRSPEISWTNVPEGTRSLVLNMRDMDVARNRTTEDQAQISASGPMYRGPGAPADGPPHHYMFELYALNITMDVPPTDDAFETRRLLS